VSYLQGKSAHEQPMPGTDCQCPFVHTSLLPSETVQHWVHSHICPSFEHALPSSGRGEGHPAPADDHARHVHIMDIPPSIAHGLQPHAPSG
jgi:hypothetical protein